MSKSFHHEPQESEETHRNIALRFKVFGQRIEPTVTAAYCYYGNQRLSQTIRPMLCLLVGYLVVAFLVFRTESSVNRLVGSCFISNKTWVIVFSCAPPQKKESE